MTNGWKIIIGILILGIATITACGSSGGGGGGTTASTPATCVYDSNGNCVAGVGSTGYIGDGQWSGRLIASNMNLFQQFAYENGLCTGQDCAYLSGYIQVQLVLQTGGCLPGPGTFTIQTFRQGYQGPTMSQRGDAYINGSGNGFLINYTSTGGVGSYGTYNVGYTNNNQSVGTMQIVTSFPDSGSHNRINIAINYRGSQIASTNDVPGSGYAQYNPTAAAQGAQYCGGGGYGGSQPYGGYGTTSPYGPYGGGYYGGVNYNTPYTNTPYTTYNPYSFYYRTY